MIFEKWDAKFDVEALKMHLHQYVLPLPPIAQSEAFAGWSVISSDGSYKDGWHKGHLAMKNADSQDNILQNLKNIGGKESSAYVVPTEICHGYLKEVLEVIQQQQLNPRRMRIIRLSAQQASIWHRDAPDDMYGVRLHIPIETNSECFFETRAEKGFLPADGSAYFLKVNREHRVTNGGPTMRYHIVADVTDQSNFTKFHQFPVKA